MFAIVLNVPEKSTLSEVTSTLSSDDTENVSKSKNAENVCYSIKDVSVTWGTDIKAYF